MVCVYVMNVCGMYGMVCVECVWCAYGVCVCICVWYV